MNTIMRTPIKSTETFTDYVSHASHRLGPDVIRSIRCERVAESCKPHRHGLWVWQSGDVRQRNQNLQNEPGMSFGINATKNALRKEEPKRRLRLPLP